MRWYKVRCQESSKAYIDAFGWKHTNKSKAPLLTRAQAKIAKRLHDVDFGEKVAVIENVWLQENALFIAVGFFGLVLIVLSIIGFYLPGVIR